MRISIIGLGYIGMPTGILFAKAGHDVQGYDISEGVVASLNAGRLHIEEPGLQDLLEEVMAAGKFQVSTTLQPADVFIICVPTPFRKDKSPDLSYVESATASVAAVVKPGDLVILESTAPVNTTRDTVLRILQDAKHEDVLVAHCPETVLPGNMIRELIENHRVIGGLTPGATSAAVALYKTVVRAEIHETDAATAEFVKLIENTYRDVNIALANELNAVGKALGVNTRSAIKLANRHPRVHIHTPGPGVGGHCIPVDPWFIISSVKEAPLISTAREINDSTPSRVAAAAIRLLDGLEHPRVALFGLAYKGNVDDVRESASFGIISELRAAGVVVQVHDPHVPLGRWENTTAIEAARGADLVIITTDHRVFSTTEMDAVRSAVRRPRVLNTRDLDLTNWLSVGFEEIKW